MILANRNKVILVDHNDREIGIMDKLPAHLEGVLHRAFSVFVFNDNMELLMQCRANSKYHSGGLWSNTCCSHPMPGESLFTAAHRRMKEELGLTVELKKAGAFVYKARINDRITEYELDHVLFGISNDLPRINPSEVKEWAYWPTAVIERKLKEQPFLFTAWFRLIFPAIKSTLSGYEISQEENTGNDFDLIDNYSEASGRILYWNSKRKLLNETL